MDAGLAMAGTAGARAGALQGIPWRWIALWLLLPNIAIVVLWPFVGLPMQAAILLSGGLAMIFSLLPWRSVRALGAAAIFIAVSTIYVCKLFAIPPLNFGMIAQFLSDVRPLRSPEYLAGLGIALGVLAAILWFVPRAPRLEGSRQLMQALAAIALFFTIDGALAFDSRLANQTLPVKGTKVDSAVIQSGLHAPGAGQRHVIVILVEALGVPSMPEEQAIFAATWNRPEWRGRYVVESGVSQYFGSTTNGELRELCARWAHYQGFAFEQSNCLPARFRRSGYETTAYHAFTGNMFDRKDWYPRIGFDRMVFGEEMLREGAQACPGVFPGACDVDVAARIEKQLASATQPQFIYWLTLNTHVPVVADKAMGTSHCSVGTAQWREDFPSLCRLYQLHHVLADRIARMAMAPGFPKADILIVGDHKPPIFDRHELARFKDGEVPWIYLRAR